MLATRNKEPRIMAAICTLSITVREMACHCRKDRVRHRNGLRVCKPFGYKLHTTS